MNRGELTYRQAVKEILAILDQVSDAQIPKPDRIERPGDTPDGIAWFGGKGYHVRPTTMRASRSRAYGLVDVFENEWLYRERVRVYGKNFEFRDGAQLGGFAW